MLIPGEARGRVMGGNLATLAALCGTPFAPSFKGCIVFLEEVHEHLYRIDRMMTQMMLSRCFNGVKGVVLGSFTDCGEPAAVHKLMTDHFAALNIPIVANMPIGHGVGNWTVPIGMNAILNGANGTLTFTKP